MNHFSIPATPMNHALAATVARRLKSDAQLLAARAEFWRCLGWSMFVLAFGGAMGLAFFGFSYITDGQAAVNRVSEAIANGLNKAIVRTDGTVKLDPASTVKLDTAGGVVKLDMGDGTLRLDSPPIRVDMPRPTTAQIDASARPLSQAKTVTNYTVFKDVSTDQGNIVTGWIFQSSEDAVPDSQFCYFMKNTGDKTAIRYNIAANGVMQAANDLPIDATKAFANCVWFTRR